MTEYSENEKKTTNVGLGLNEKIALTLKQEHKELTSKKPTMTKLKVQISADAKNLAMNITPEMLVVKDFYWGMKMEGMEITVEQAARQCDINDNLMAAWESNDDFHRWFHEPPVKMKAALKSLAYTAIREGRKLLQDEDPEVRFKMVKYLIDQTTGKAAEKGSAGQFDEEDDGILEDQQELDKLMKQLNKERENGKDTESD